MATIEISVQVENIAAVLVTYNTLRLYRCIDPGGDFLGGGVIDSETLVTDEIDYTLTDPAGSSAYAYRYAFYNGSTLVQSSLSDAFFPTGRNCGDIIIEASKKAKGFKGECSALGDETTLIDDQLAENGVDEDYLAGAWVFRPDAADTADLQRRLTQSPFSLSASSLTPARAWTNPPASGEAYAVFGYLPPLPGRGGYSWMEALSDALAGLLVPDIIDVGVQAATGSQDRWGLTAHAGYVEKNLVRKVYFRTYDPDDSSIYVDLDASKNQLWWEYKTNGRDDCHIYTGYPPRPGEHVIVDLSRKFDRVYRPDDITLCPFDLAVAATVQKVWEYLNVISDGKYSLRLQMASQALLSERSNTRALIAVKQ